MMFLMSRAWIKTDWLSCYLKSPQYKRERHLALHICRIWMLRGSLKGTGVLKSLMDDRKREREL